METSDPVRSAIVAVADRHFEQSNAKGPEWQRKANAHAFGGAMNALRAYDAAQLKLAELKAAS